MLGQVVAETQGGTQISLERLTQLFFWETELQGQLRYRFEVHPTGQTYCQYAGTRDLSRTTLSDRYCDNKDGSEMDEMGGCQ